ncbi:MAG: hypothetical protein HOE90_04875 [Bacteriovoracaceae bacterium]|jgi:hypothetical protein|nr:hypothetical protein [Bacteriovoracaceae bacterium]
MSEILGTGAPVSAADSLITIDHDLEIISKRDDRFKVEINLGLALPFKYYLTDDYDKTEASSAIVRNVDDNGSVYMLEVTTQSNEGPLQAFENDVLLVLLTMAWEQRDRNKNSKERMNGFRVYYTHAEVCRRLGLSANSRNKVARAIKKIKSQNLQTKNFAYNAETGDVGLINEDTKIILKSGRVRRGTSDMDFANFQDVFFIEFDSYIVKNLYNEYVSVISSNAYLSLKSGPQRRVLIFLYSKRKKFGDQFIFPLEELAQVIGLTGSSKRRRQIGEYLKRIQEGLNSFDFTIKKSKSKADWDILIVFKNTHLIEDNESITDPFLKSLWFYYGAQEMENLNLTPLDIDNMKREFTFKYQKEKDKDTFLYGKSSYLACEFCLDVTLYQVLKCGYRVTKSFKALARSILGSMIEGSLELPEGYRQFVTIRAEEKKKKDVDGRINTELVKREEAKKEEVQKLENSFERLYYDMLKNNRSFKEQITKRALAALESDGVNSSDPLYNLSLEHKMRDIAKVDFFSGDILNYKNIKDKFPQ